MADFYHTCPELCQCSRSSQIHAKFIEMDILFSDVRISKKLGKWTRSRGDKVDVAIKQLETKYGLDKLMDFMDTCVSRYFEFRILKEINQLFLLVSF